MGFQFSRFYAIFRARNREFYRDIGAMGWTFIFPFLVVLGFSYAFNIGETGFSKVALVGEAPGHVKLVEWVSFESQEEALEKLRHHKVDALLITSTGGSQPVVWTNASSAKSQIAEKILEAQLTKESEPALKKEQIEVAEIKYVDWLLPGLVSMNVVWLATFGVGWVIVRQRKLGVLKRLKASPLTALEYLSAHMVSRMIVLVLTGAIVVAGSWLIYPFQMQGSFFDFFFVYALGCLSLCGFGLVIASRMESDEFASGILNLVTFPMIFMSEVWFSLEGSPVWVKWAAQTMPLWHMTDAMRQIMNEGAGLAQVSSSLVFLCVATVFLTGLGAVLFRWNKE